MLMRWKKITLVVLSLILCLSSTPLYAQGGRGGYYTYGECSRIDREALRGEIERTALTVLSERGGDFNIPTVVARKWVELDVDATIDGEVARAVNRVAQEEGYFSRLWSGWSAGQAEQFAMRIADDAFGSPAFRQKIDELSAAIAGEIAKEMEADFARAASAAFLCMKAFVGERYSETLFAAFENRVSVEVEEASVGAVAPVDVSIIDVHGRALGGVGLIVVTEIARRVSQRLSYRIAERIAGRIAGRVLGRAGSSLIPIAGWVIGLGLIVWDLWEGGQGALPQIEEALTSEEVKERIRSEIADSIKHSLPDETALVALEIAVTILEEWEGFCGRYPDVCSLAQENATFQAILNDTPLDQLDTLALLTNTLLAYAGRVELEAALASGQFETALALPEESYTIVQTSRSLAPLLAWAQLAGDRLDQVIAYGIHRHKTPADFSPALLSAVLDVGDAAAIDKLMALNQAELEALVTFAGESLGPLAANRSLDEIRQLVGYLTAPPPELTATPPADLAPKLASGEITVGQLFEPTPTVAATAVLTATAALPAQPTAVESAAPVNSIVVASAILVVLVLVAGGALWWRRRPPVGQHVLSSKSERADG
jgi:hypothetical protein